MSNSAYRKSLWNVPLRPMPASHEPYHTMGTRDLPATVDQTGTVVYPAHDIYNRAINVSSPRLVDGEDPQSATYRKKVLRRVEVPYTREVKVPAQSTQLVDTMVEQPVSIRRHVAVPATKLVEEPYTAYEEKDAVRDREVWVRQIVPERYKVRVPVQRTRLVEMPTTIIKEVDDVAVVQVPTTRAVQVDGFRIDQVQDSKVMEVEEYQQFRMRPEPVGPPQPHTARELGRVPGRHLTRTPGPAVFHPEHPAVSSVHDDSPMVSPNPYQQPMAGSRGLPFAGTQTRGLGGMRSIPPPSLSSSQPLGATSRGVAMPSSSYYPARPSMQSMGATMQPYSRADPSSYGLTYGQRAMTGGARDSPSIYDTRNIKPAGSFKKEASLSKTVRGRDVTFETGQYRSSPLGMTVRGTHTRHTDGTGVLVAQVDKASLAARAGLVDNDIITAVGGAPITTVDEFKSRLNAPVGTSVPIEFNRDGRKGIVAFMPKGGAPLPA